MVVRPMVAQAGVLVLAMIGGVVQAAPRQGPIYAVTRVGSALSPEDKIGARRAGLMCMPNGAIRWGDVAVGAVMDQREAVQDALEDADLPVTPLGLVSGEGSRSALRLRATIKAADFRLCAKHFLGDAKTYSGDAALDIEWRVESPDGRETPHLSHVSRRIAEDHGASLGAIYRQLLAEAARDAAHWLLAPQN